MAAFGVITEVAAVGMLLPYASEYLLNTPGQTANYLLAFAAPILVSIPFWLRLSRRFGKKYIWMTGLGMKVMAFAVLFFSMDLDQVVVYIVIGIMGAAHGCGSVIPQSLLADAVDFDEVASGQRKEGAYFALLNFAMKSAMAVSATVVGFALQAAGFRSNIEQAASVQMVIRIMIAAAPCLLHLCALVLLHRLQLTQQEHEKIRAELDGRYLKIGSD
ncbi:MAG: hypothetical protein GY725_21480 [bacterium]|nr:hypothetical protein [bacterium]